MIVGVYCGHRLNGMLQPHTYIHTHTDTIPWQLHCQYGLQSQSLHRGHVGVAQTGVYTEGVSAVSGNPSKFSTNLFIVVKQNYFAQNIIHV